MKPNRWITLYLRRILIAPLCGLTIAFTSAHAQAVGDPAAESTTNPPSASKSGGKAAATTPKPKETEVKKKDASSGRDDDDTIRMSAFQVTTDKDKGYLGGNAMSGTRLNSDIDDIAASVTVVTKQQLLDTAAVDINDIFAYEVSTEGTRTYTANFNDGKGDVDQVALNPEVANRVRGLGNANIAVGNFAASSSIPIDTYNVDAVEISRGPNSSIFGVGEVSGTINLVPASANVTRDSSRIQASVSSYGTTRETLDANRVIVKDKLAFRLSAVHEDQEFLRKPSYDQTRRLQLAATLKPFKWTTLTVSYEKFREAYDRPNSATPRDLMPYWNQVGRPSYDPTTNIWNYTDSAGTVHTGTVVTNRSNGTTLFPVGVVLQGMGSNRVRPSMWIDQGKTQWFGTSFWATGTVSREIAQIAYDGSAYNVPLRFINTLPYTGLAAVSDKSLYDYEKINIAGLNTAKKSAELIRLQLEQYLLKTDHHVLAFQVGYYKENIGNYQRTFVGLGGDGVPSLIQPDVNTKLPDGTPNPYYGAPYMTALAPQTYSNPINTETARLNLAYQLDMTHDKNIFRFLGKHNLVGYGENYQKVFAPKSLRYIDQIDQSQPPWLLPSIRNSNSAKWNARYYLGDSNGGNVDYASAAPDMSTPVTFTRFNPPPPDLTSDPTHAVNQWYTQSVPTGTEYFSQTLEQVKTTTLGVVLQSYLVNDRAVLTYGRRRDTLATRDNNKPEPASVINPDGLNTSLAWLNDFSGIPYLPTNKKTGATKNIGYTSTKGFVVKPFHWLNLRYSQSNSFKPESYAVDFQANPLSNPHGKTKDYGFQLNLFKDKLWLRVTRFQTESEGSRNNAASTVAGRITNFDFDPDPAADGSKVDLQDWVRDDLLRVKGYYNPITGALDPNIPADVMAAAELEADKYIGLDPQRIADLRAFTKTLTADVQSRGYEVEINFNPNAYWTVKATGSETVNIISSIGSTWQQYRDERMPIWLSIKSPLDGTPYWNHIFSGNNVPSIIWVGQNQAPMEIQLALQGKPSPLTSKYKGSLLTTYRLAGISSNKYLRAVTIGGSLRWVDKAGLGFYGAAPEADGFVRSYDPNRPIYDTSHAYGDMWLRYDFAFYSNRIKGNVQLNIRNIAESGRLQAFGANPDGTLFNYRIIDPREFILGVSLDL